MIAVPIPPSLDREQLAPATPVAMRASVLSPWSSSLPTASRFAASFFARPVFRPVDGNPR